MWLIRAVIKYFLAFSVLTGALLALFEFVLLPLYVGINNEHFLPDLRGEVIEVARMELIRNGFRIEIIRKPFSPEHHPGTIIGMSPPPFTKVKEGRVIKLTVAQERTDVTIPDFVNQTLRNALLEMERIGLEQDTVMEEFNAGFEKGVITYQAPRAGQRVKTGAGMTFMVSKGDPPDFFRVPDLVNLSLSKAENKLLESGLKLGDVSREYHPDLIPNTVIDQSLTAGMRLSIPARVDVVVSTDRRS